MATVTMQRVGSVSEHGVRTLPPETRRAGLADLRQTISLLEQQTKAMTSSLHSNSIALERVQSSTEDLENDQRTLSAKVVSAEKTIFVAKRKVEQTTQNAGRAIAVLLSVAVQAAATRRKASSPEPSDLSKESEPTAEVTRQSAGVLASKRKREDSPIPSPKIPEEPFRPSKKLPHYNASAKHSSPGQDLKNNPKDPFGNKHPSGPVDNLKTKDYTDGGPTNESFGKKDDHGGWDTSRD
jgi:hypothetical protein